MHSINADALPKIMALAQMHGWDILYSWYLVPQHESSWAAEGMGLDWLRILRDLHTHYAAPCIVQS